MRWVLLWLCLARGSSTFGDREGIARPLQDDAAATPSPYPPWFDAEASLRVPTAPVQAPVAVRGASGEQQLHGAIGLGSDGAPDWSPVPLPNGGEMSRAQQTEAHRGYCYNTARCASLPLDRAMPDVRSPQCRAQRYPALDGVASSPPGGLAGGLAASVVFIFHNEALCALLRSIHSVLNRTPPRLLHEVVLIDDQLGSFVCQPDNAIVIPPYDPCLRKLTCCASAFPRCWKVITIRYNLSGPVFGFSF